jgi:hypothetical protein
MEFWQGWPCTGCRLTPLVSIQNPGPEKCPEVRERELGFFSVMSPRYGGEMVWKKKSPRVLGLCFFPHHFPLCLGLCFFFQITEKNKVLSLTSWHFSGPGFWILTKGAKWHPVQGQPCPKSVDGLGLGRPSIHAFVIARWTPYWLLYYHVMIRK